jgi:transposase-like protein
MVPHLWITLLKRSTECADACIAWEGFFAREVPEMTCPHCHSHDLVEIRMQLHAETVTMHSCQACERRWWDRDGRSVGLRSVLDLVAAR